jgi:hypothetical protein
MKQRAKGSTFRATAYHEAGHALVALHLGCGIKLATVVPDEKAATFGHVKRWSRPALVANLSETASWREADHFLRPGEKPRPRAGSRRALFWTKSGDPICAWCGRVSPNLGAGFANQADQTPGRGAVYWGLCSACSWETCELNKEKELFRKVTTTIGRAIAKN